MSVTQPGDVTLIAPMSVQNDANYAVRGESVLGGYVALPSGSGPPTITQIPLVMRRIGMLAYTPTDGKIWQLVGGVLDANWVRWIAASPIWTTRTDWWVDAATGNDSNDGTSAHPLASMTELADRVCPGGSDWILSSNVTITVAAGTYIRAYLSVTTHSASSNFTCTIQGAFTSGPTITLATVTAPSAPNTCGELTTASGTFVAGSRIRMTSGAAAGAVAYSTGLNGGPTDTFFNEFVVPTVAGYHLPQLPSAGDTCVVDTLSPTKFFQSEFYAGNGALILVKDCQLQRFEAAGDELNTPSADGGGNVIYSGCEFVSTVGVGGNCTAGGACLFGCRVIPGANINLTGHGWLLWGCVIQGILSLNGAVVTSYGLAINGGQLNVGTTPQGVTDASPSAITLNSSFNGNGALEIENGPNANLYGAAINQAPGSVVECIGYVWGLHGTYARTAYLEAGAWIYVKETGPISNWLRAPSTIGVTLAGHDHAFSELPKSYPALNCGVTLIADATAASLPLGYSTRASWYVNSSTGSDSNDGSSGAPLATTDEIGRRLCPGGTTLQVTQSTVVYIAAGTYNEVELSLSIPVGSGYTFDLVNAYTSGSPITLSSVTDTVPSATPTRGNIQTASGAFADKARIRSTSGANAGAITYCTGLNGGATNAWVKQWFLESSLSVVTIANGTTCVVDTLQVTINRVQIRVSGHPVGGQIRIFDAILPNGIEFINTIGGSGSVFLSQCKVGSTSTARISGNVQLRNCQLVGPGQFTFFGVQPVLFGCEIETAIGAIGSLQNAGGCAFNGGSVLAGGAGSEAPSGVYLAASEWVNGTGTAVSIISGATVQVGGQQFGFGSSYAVGFALNGGSTAITGGASYLGILATQPITMAGVNVNYSDVPRVYPNAACAFVLLSDPTGLQLVKSVFGREGAVVAASGDYNSSQITNASSVTGADVTAALNALLSAIAGAGAVSSVFGRVGAVAAAIGDYTDAQIINTSTVTGAHVKDALSALNAAVAALVTGVSSFKTRTGAVTPTAGDYAASQVNNDSSTVTGTHVSDALDGLKALIAALVTGVSSVYGRTGVVVATTGDYTSSQITNSSSVSGTGVTGALNTLLSTIGGLVTGVSSVFGRTGAVVAAAGDYAASKINNDSATVSGTHVSDALDTLKSLITALVTGVSSFNSRTGAIVPATNDYTDLQIQNTSSVTGTGVKGALNTLLASINGLVTGVSSVYGRTGAVLAAANDYAASQVLNNSNIPGSTVAAALDTTVYEFPYGNSVFGSGATSYTFSTAQLGYLILLGTSSVYTFTIPTSASSGIQVGARFEVIQAAPGCSLALSVASGVTIVNSVKLTTTYAARYIFTQVATDQWMVETILPSNPTRWMPLLTGSPQTYWSFSPGIGLLSTGSGGSGTFRVPLGPFDNADLITGVAVTFKAAGGHGSLPTSGNLPKLRLYSQSLTGSSVSALASASDPSANVTAYQSVHSWSATISGGAVSAANTHFWAEFDDEVGSGALGGLLIAIGANLA